MQHYRLNGAGTLSLDAQVQQNGRLRLKAGLSPGATTAAALELPSGDRFVLAATLAATSLVCYNDTIFRDDFDGDGF